MIGVVVVSHSRGLAEAAVALANDMVAPEDRPVVAMAAGLGPDTFGTDAVAVAEAITAADGPDGVLVLMDLGSAVLSTEMALEFVEPSVRERVRVSSAPLVEGLVAAVVAASTGGTLAEVAEEAARGLAAKQEHLGHPDTELDRQATPDAGVLPEDALAVDVDVPNPNGLHARPAAKLVALARSFDAKVTIADLDTGRGPVDAGSISMVATLNARQGHRLRITATGPDAQTALDAITTLAHTGFGDLTPPLEPETSSGVGGDVAVGVAIVIGTEVDLGGYTPGDPEVESRRSKDAVAVVGQAVRQLRDNTAEPGIFEAHLALLDDPALTEQVDLSIQRGTAAPEAWAEALNHLASEFEALDDPYQRERAQDIRAVRRQLLLALTGRPVDVDHGRGILVVPEIDAATAATVDATRVTGIATRYGGGTGHGVIVARSRGIPIITGIGDIDIPQSTLVGFNARARRFVVDPDETVQAELRALMDQRSAERTAALRLAGRPAITKDGVTVRVLANVGSVEDARAAAAYGAEGSGLVRTEVLFGDRAASPGPAEQLAAYTRIAEALGGRPITIRTWDVGGDKPLRFLPQGKEANPFLGERGLRVFRRRPELLRTQLEAIIQMAAPVRVMFPMVTTVDEKEWVLDLVHSIAGHQRLEFGIMVEVPAAALRIRHLATGLDFVSIGTNDLTQYLTAADRGNSAVAELADGLDPAVLSVIAQVVRDVPDNVEVAVCGDLASDPDAAILLVGLGIRELSAIPPQIPLVKSRLRGIDTRNAADLAGRATAVSSARDVRNLLTATDTP